MSANLFRNANEAFNNGEFSRASSLYEKCGKKFGMQTVAFNLALCKKKLELNHDSEIIEHSVKNKVKPEEKKTTTASGNKQIPVTPYQKIISFNKDFHLSIKKNEHSFLLNYAASLRAVEMSETYINLIKYLTLKFNKFDLKHKKLLINHIRLALTISKDKELIELATKVDIGILFCLDISNEVFADSLGLEFTLVAIGKVDKNFLYEYQHQPSFLISMLKNKCSDDYQNLLDSPQLYCAIANTLPKLKSFSEKYKSSFNIFLSRFGLPTVKTINNQSENILSSISFRSIDSSNAGPLVSIIMSSYNSALTIGYAVLSLMEQSYKSIEILVCDDGSDDNTVEILKSLSNRDGRVKVFQSNDNHGTYNIRNDLIDKAKGKYITFLDSDDYALPNRIFSQVKCLESDSEKMMCFTKWIRIQPNGMFVFFFDGLLTRFCVVSAMVRKEVFDILPKFRSSLVAADTEFYELSKLTFGIEKIAVIDKPLILGLWGENSLTKRDNLTAEHSGFVAQRRRLYSDIAARQRVLGEDIVTNTDVEGVLSELGIFRAHQGMKLLNKKESK